MARSEEVEVARETFVVMFRSPSEAEQARRDLEAAGFPSSDINLRSRGETGTADVAAPAAGGQRDEGFLDWLFGSRPSDEELTGLRQHVYDRNGAVLSIRADTAEHDPIAAIVERYDVLDFSDDARADDRLDAGTAGPTDRGTATPSTALPTGAMDEPTARRASPGTETETVIPTAKEELEVGKRVVEDARAYRIRRYVIEQPVEEQVQLRDETVIVERREPTRAGSVGEQPFEEKVVEVTERHEEPVVTKVVRPGEEVVVRKEETDRVATVRDKVRETRVEVDRAAAGDKPGTKDAAPDVPPSVTDPSRRTP
jgi:hypothetical protein